MSIKTEKYYYKEPYLSRIDAEIIDIIDNKIVLDRTVAFAEGGGQEGDRGDFLVDGKKVPFYDTKKGVGKMLYIENFPTIQVDTPIYHFVDEKELNSFEVGKRVTVKIDTVRRAKLSISHSAIHLVLMSLEKIYPDYESRIYGASIKRRVQDLGL